MRARHAWGFPSALRWLAANDWPCGSEKGQLLDSVWDNVCSRTPCAIRVRLRLGITPILSSSLVFTCFPTPFLIPPESTSLIYYWQVNHRLKVWCWEPDLRPGPQRGGWWWWWEGWILWIILIMVKIKLHWVLIWGAHDLCLEPGGGWGRVLAVSVYLASLGDLWCLLGLPVV